VIGWVLRISSAGTSARVITESLSWLTGMGDFLFHRAADGGRGLDEDGGELLGDVVVLAARQQQDGQGGQEAERHHGKA